MFVRMRSFSHFLKVLSMMLYSTSDYFSSSLSDCFNFKAIWATSHAFLNGLSSLDFFSLVLPLSFLENLNIFPLWIQFFRASFNFTKPLVFRSLLLWKRQCQNFRCQCIHGSPFEFLFIPPKTMRTCILEEYVILNGLKVCNPYIWIEVILCHLGLIAYFFLHLSIFILPWFFN